MTSRMHLATRTLGVTLAAMLSLGMATSASAAEAAAADAAAAKPITEVQELDEVVVRGTAIKDRIAKAEDIFFQAFNKANKDDDFDTSCVLVALDGATNIKTRMCIPGFYADAMADQVYFQQSCASDKVEDADGTTTEFAATACYTPPRPQDLLTERSREYANHMMRVIRTDPKLQDMAGNLDDLYKELIAAQSQYNKVKLSKASTTPAKPAESQPVVH